MKLRDYQERSVRKLWAAFRDGKRRVLFTLPTGAGKTVVAVHMMQQWLARGARILFISGRREHINQAYKTLLAYGFSKDDLSVIMQKDDPRENRDARIQIASKDTLARRPVKPKADVVIVDESHHAVADGYLALQKFYPFPTVWLGLTATPYRRDGRGLALAFDVLIVGALPSELIACGALMKPRVFTVPEKERRKLAKSLREVRTVGGDFSQDGLAKVVQKHRRFLVGDIPKYWRRFGKGRPTVVYAANLRHGRQLVGVLDRAGARAALLTGKTPTEERESMIGGPSGWEHSKLARGELDVVVNCGVLVEGWDCPPVKCVIIARPTRSLAFWVHACGRALRPGKMRPVILDHAGNALRAGIRCLPHDDLVLTLEAGAGKRAGPKAPAGPKVCPDCGAVAVRGAEQCEECPHVFIKEPEQVDGKLVELTDEQIEQIIAKERDRLRKLVACGVVRQVLVEPFLKVKKEALRQGATS